MSTNASCRGSVARSKRSSSCLPSWRRVARLVRAALALLAVRLLNARPARNDRRGRGRTEVVGDELHEHALLVGRPQGGRTEHRVQADARDRMHLTRRSIAEPELDGVGRSVPEREVETVCRPRRRLGAATRRQTHVGLRVRRHLRERDVANAARDAVATGCVVLSPRLRFDSERQQGEGTARPHATSAGSRRATRGGSHRRSGFDVGHRRRRREERTSSTFCGGLSYPGSRLRRRGGHEDGNRCRRRRGIALTEAGRGADGSRRAGRDDEHDESPKNRVAERSIAPL